MGYTELKDPEKGKSAKSSQERLSICYTELYLAVNKISWTTKYTLSIKVYGEYFAVDKLKYH